MHQTEWGRGHRANVSITSGRYQHGYCGGSYLSGSAKGFCLCCDSSTPSPAHVLSPTIIVPYTPLTATSPRTHDTNRGATSTKRDQKSRPSHITHTTNQTNGRITQVSQIDKEAATKITSSDRSFGQTCNTSNNISVNSARTLPIGTSHRPKSAR